MKKPPSTDAEPPAAKAPEAGPEPFSEVPRYRSISPSLRAGPRSIRTLRPISRTDQPPPEEPPTRESPRKRGAWGAMIALAVGASFVFGAWIFHERSKHHPAPSVLIVNGSPAFKKTPAGAVERWPGDAEVTIAIDTSMDQLAPGAHDAVIEAFGTWLGSGASVPKLRFDSAQGTQPSVQPDGHNVVMFAPIDIPGHKNDLAITIGFSDDSNGQLVEADMIFNSNKKFGIVTPPEPDGADDATETSSCGVYDIQSVATHEAGHFFGLGEDMDDHAATMFFKTGKCEIGKRQLKPSDSSAMIGLYSGALTSANADSPGGCAVCASATSKTGDGTAAQLFGLVMAALGWTRRQRR